MPDPIQSAGEALPTTLDAALDPAWLTGALRPVTGGATVTGVEVVEVLRTMATKVRFVAHWTGRDREGSGAFCLKAFLDVDAESARGRPVTIVEADFYDQLAPALPLRVPTCVASLVDRVGGHGVILMRDLVVDGARFCTALEPLDADQASASLDQLARLHAGAALLERAPWIGRRLSDFASGLMPEGVLQGLLDGPRGEGLEAQVRDAGRLLAGLSALAAEDARGPDTLIHGDCHAGNLYQTAGGPGLIDWQLLQRGGWALDVAYHISAVLPVELAEREEDRLLRDYLDRARSYGCSMPGFDEAQRQYRQAVVYGYFLWAITRRVEPAIVNSFVHRLGAAVARHESYRALGL